ncbi:MAG: hypothetical protein F2534_16610 [Actinobacteria bacterium]|uniref:Unannotated protein n=1 Tax=freshwater metagenome TaxID=449393 RepID=A0A6J6F8G2_9ZZZZ|nr:hypothetical protein [Actinomycetota bacterium]
MLGATDLTQILETTEPQRLPSPERRTDLRIGAGIGIDEAARYVGCTRIALIRYELGHPIDDEHHERYWLVMRASWAICVLRGVE